MLKLFDNGIHRVLVFRDLTPKGIVQTNQCLIIEKDKGVLIDPGGRVTFKALISKLSGEFPITRIEYILFTHQDPDVIGAVASWKIAIPRTKIVLPSVWMRFLPHMFPPDKGIEEDIVPIDDSGANIKLYETTLKIIPSHFLHSPGNFSVYDPVSKILFSGDIGASLIPSGQDYDFVEDFDAHVKYMESFHKRYMASNKACRKWVEEIKDIDVEIIVPQHGAVLKGRDIVERFLEWLSNLKCGVDLLQ